MLEVSTAFTCKAMVELVPALTLRDLEAQWRDLIAAEKSFTNLAIMFREAGNLDDAAFWRDQAIIADGRRELVERTLIRAEIDILERQERESPM